MRLDAFMYTDVFKQIPKFSEDLVSAFIFTLKYRSLLFPHRIEGRDLLIAIILKELIIQLFLLPEVRLRVHFAPLHEPRGEAHRRKLQMRVHQALYDLRVGSRTIRHHELLDVCQADAACLPSSPEDVCELSRFDLTAAGRQKDCVRSLDPSQQSISRPRVGIPSVMWKMYKKLSPLEVLNQGGRPTPPAENFRIIAAIVKSIFRLIQVIEIACEKNRKLMEPINASNPLVSRVLLFGKSREGCEHRAKSRKNFSRPNFTLYYDCPVFEKQQGGIFPNRPEVQNEFYHARLAWLGNGAGITGRKTLNASLLSSPHGPLAFSLTL